MNYIFFIITIVAFGQAIAKSKLEIPKSIVQIDRNPIQQEKNKDPIKFRYQRELIEMIRDYSIKYDEKFIVDPGVRGKITIFSVGNPSQSEAFKDLVRALMINGYTAIRKEDSWIIRSSRNAQRDGIPVYVNELPPEFPELMITYIHQLKSKKAEKINMELRVLTSKDGEMSISSDDNSIIISDYTSNIHRVVKILNELDK